MKACFIANSSNPLQLVYSCPRRTSLALLLLTLSFCLALAQQNQPATHLHFNDDTSKIQFAIISDLWGNYRSGLFEDAIDKLELLQPQFVMSVGDLIDGKIYDSTLLDQQWSEFNEQVNSLSMPFFYVPGNHDISNPWMEMEWKRRFCKSYYCFIHNNVLFLCINTQDGGASGIHEEQITYFRKVIGDHPNVRWTFIFIHRPVWQGEEESQLGNAAAGDGSIKVLFRVPDKKIAKPDHSFRFNIGYRDQDKEPVQDYSVMNWKLLWYSDAEYKYSGTFLLNNLN